MKQRYNKPKIVTLAALTMGLAIAVNADPTITGVTAQQRYPWNGKVDIAYTASGVTEAAKAQGMVPSIKVLAVDRTTTPWTTNVARSSFLFVGPKATEVLTDNVAISDGEHRIVWDMNAQGFTFASGNIVFAVLGVMEPGVQLWEDGPYWAECNVGASKPEEYGYYFWWGDTVGYKRNSANDGWDAVDGSGTGFRFSYTNTIIATYNKAANTLTTAGYIDGTTNLVAECDAAAEHLGALWRLPTDAEILALSVNCSFEWSENWEGTGVNGWLVKGKDDYAAKRIFLPAAGYGRGSCLTDASSYGGFWSSSPCSACMGAYMGAASEIPQCLDNVSRAWGFNFDCDGRPSPTIIHRYYGQTVRPVRGSAK